MPGDITEFRNMRFHCKELVVDGKEIAPEAKNPSEKIADVTCSTWTDTKDDLEATINAMLKAMRDDGLVKS